MFCGYLNIYLIWLFNIMWIQSRFLWGSGFKSPIWHERAYYMIPRYIKSNKQNYPELLRDTVVLGVGGNGGYKESQGTFWVLVRWVYLLWKRIKLDS